MKYYYNDGYHSHGPFSLDQFENLEIYSHTLINVVGTRSWVKAKDLVEFLPFTKQPPTREIRKREGRQRSRTKLDHNKVKELLEQANTKKKEKVTFEIIDLDSRGIIKSHLFSSIVSIFSFFILGILAVINSSKVNAENRRNNVQAARKESRITRRLAYSGIFFGAGLVLWGSLMAQLVYSIIEIS